MKCTARCLVVFAVVLLAMRTAYAQDESPSNSTTTAASSASVQPTVTPVVDTGKESLVSELMILEKLRRTALIEHGISSLAAGRKALRNGDYDDAKIHFENVLQYMPDSSETRVARTEATDGIREALYRNAVLAWKKGDLETAIRIARAANEKGHPDAAKLIGDIQKEIDNPPKAQNTKQIARMDEPSYKDGRSEINVHFQRARQYYIVGEYDRARAEVEIILRDHPYNTEAIDLLKRIGDRTNDISEEEFAATRVNMIREVANTWTPRRYAIDTVQIKDTSTARSSTPRTLTESGLTSEQMIEAKMKAIMLPDISFRNANITDVIAFFESSSREYDDPSLPADKRGVNFVLKSSGVAPASAPAGSAPATGAAPAGDAAAAPAGDIFSAAAAGSTPPITFNARFISLWESLKVVTDVAGYKFRVRGNIVMVMPLNMPDMELEARTYTVLSSLSDRLQKVSTDLTAPKASGGGTGGGFVGMTADTSEEHQDWKKFFEGLGVQWPQGSSISYLATIGKLRVVNTSENLAIFETALQDLNVTPRQIEIEARFVEVDQNDLDAIGFDWWMNNSISDMSAHGHGLAFGSPSATTAGLPYFSGAPGELTSGLRYMSTGAQGAANTLNDGLLEVQGVFGKLDLDTIIHLLSQRSNTDLLSAPKVVTKSGQEAVMKVVTEYIYPTTFTVQLLDTVTTSGTGSTGVPTGGIVTPGGFETREVGVILQVVPEVSAEGQMINLTMNPQVVSPPTWFNYGSTIPLASGGTETLWMPQPFFSVRSVSTSLSIYNGSTVVMGGMITESRSTTEDKVPFLGDIPYFGKFFTSTTTSTDKRNLLIFVTARLVDPAGRSVKTTADSGLSGEKMVKSIVPVSGVAPAGKP